MSERSYVKLELRLAPGEDGYRVDFSYVDPDPKDAAEMALESGTFVLDRAALIQEVDPEKYGVVLTQQFFADEMVRRSFEKARARAGATSRTLRICLRIAGDAPRLHDLRWELLGDPADEARPLSMTERVLFSRFMMSEDAAPLQLSRKAGLKALIAVAAPTDHEEWEFAEVPREKEIERAEKALAEIQVDILDEPLTLQALAKRLRDNDPDILYLVGHGQIHSRSKKPRLLLQEEDGKAVWIEGEELVGVFKAKASVPRLIVMASCQSAAKEGSDGSARSSIARLLAEAGVPAILAMQGNITMKTVEIVMPAFFQELLEDGMIDRALAVARKDAELEKRSDRWMPALFMRLKDGCIWYEAGFTGEEGEFRRWENICSDAELGDLIPILGPDIGAHVHGNTWELAKELADNYQFPMAKHEAYDLAKVVQYIVIDQSRDHARSQVKNAFGKRIVEKHGDLFSKARKEASSNEEARDQFLDAVVGKHLEDENDVYTILADLKCKLYVTTSFNPLLSKALEQSDREPEQTLYCQWRQTREKHEEGADRQQYGDLDADHPLVYHVFGVDDDDGSMVLTEDEFFDYLIKSSKYSLIPDIVKGAWAGGSLIFLGFQLNDWRFRVLFRQIMSMDSTELMKMGQRAHVGVQVNPEDHSVEDVRNARLYLQNYFKGKRSVGQDEPDIHIYWGSAADFLRELQEKRRERKGSGASERSLASVAADDGFWG